MFPADDPHHQPPLENGLEVGARGLLGEQPGDIDWLDRARSTFHSSDTWFGASMRNRLERDLAAFFGRHAPGSKYHTEQYLKKSRLFRPKTRAAIRRGEAGHAIAFFSTADVVHCSARNESDPRQVLAAEVHNALINERLNDPRQHWFKTLIGGAQDAMTVGTVISKQVWDFRMAEREVEVTYEEPAPDGRRIITQDRVREKRVLVDRPACKLIPTENLRLDPGCDWIDPVNTSPYLIEMQPTYIGDIKARIREGKYRQISDAALAAASSQDWDAIRKAREGGRLDKYDNNPNVNDHRVTWVHHNIVHVDGQDWVYDTLGTEILLMDPVAIEEYYLHAQTLDRPFQIGSAIIEAHRNYPGGIPALIEDLQEQTNDIANLRIDNVRGALNPRWILRRGSGVDARGLIRNVPSGVTYAQNVNSDIRELRTQDVTRSAYEEQDRINADIDDIVGTFSGGSVSTNRRVQETVGGMNLLSADANRLEEYMIRTVTETWIEGVMRQFVALEAAYESDERILATIAARLRQDLKTVLEVIVEPVNVQIAVGFNATNPQRRIDKLALGLATVSAYMPDVVRDIDRKEVVKEVFGALGYKDGARFFPRLYDTDVDPRIQQLEEQVQQLTAALESESFKEQTKITVAQIAASQRDQDSQRKAGIAAMKLEAEEAHRQLQSRIDQVDAQLRIEENDIKRRELYMQREALSHEIQESDRQFLLEIRKLEDQKQERQLMASQGGKPGAGKPGGSKSTAAPAKPAAATPAGGGKAGTIARDRYGMVPFKSDGASSP